ncbi:MAG: Synerg-CTERM sorting domain-containing protein [Cloacibacillus sp.]
MRQRKEKKIRAAVLVGALVFAIAAGVFLSPLPAAAAWDGSADTSWYNDSQSVFTICSPAQLAGLAMLLDGNNALSADFSEKTIRLAADIDLAGKQWTPIGAWVDSKKTRPFRGIFDGQGHKITGLYVTSGRCAGLFGYVRNGVIKNLSVAGSVSGGSYMGAVAGWIEGMGGDSLIENCRVVVAVSSAKAAYIGAVAGYNKGSGGTASIVACSADSTLTTSYDGPNAGFIGGITGGNLSYSGGAAVVQGCAASSAIAIPENGVNTNWQAGLVCGTNRSTEAELSSVLNCAATGLIKGDALYAGGVTGHNYAYSRGSVVLDSCIVTADISTTHPVGMAGGVEGYNYTVNEGASQVRNCFFNGSVKGAAAAGGVAGTSACMAQSTSVYFNCVTQGACVATNSASGSTQGCAGVIALVQCNEASSISIQNCSSETVLSFQSGVEHKGGVAGYVDIMDGASACLIKNCSAASPLSAASGAGYAGGVAGYIRSAGGAVTVANCGWLDAGGAPAFGGTSGQVLSNAASFDAAELSSGVVAACLPNQAALFFDMDKGAASASFNLVTYPSTGADFSKYVSCGVKNTNTGAVFAAASANVVTVAPLAAGGAQITAALSLKPTLFAGASGQQAEAVEAGPSVFAWVRANTTPEPVKPVVPGSSGGGGCSAGYGVLLLAALLPLALYKKISGVKGRFRK